MTEINETSDSDAHSKRPSDVSFKQQRLPAWQPKLTAGTALPIFFLIGIIFIPVGVILLYFSDAIMEHVINYTECIEENNNNNVTCAEIIRQGISKNCTCRIDFQLENDFNGEVFMYYGMRNFYQNHRRYVRSRDDDQLLGGLSKKPSSDCIPFRCPNDDDCYDGKPFAPCGAIANSLFSDELVIYYNDPHTPLLEVPVIRTDIAWPSDNRARFQNPADFPDSLKGRFERPLAWNRDLWQLDELDNDNNGFENEDLMVWMRNAALPNFRKLYRRINHQHDNFRDGLRKGNYTFYVTYRYSVAEFGGAKEMILTNMSLLGGKNPFLGIAYIVIGSVCLFLGIVVLLIHFTTTRSANNQL